MLANQTQNLNRPFRLWVIFLSALMATGIAAGVIVFWQGLVVTNLSDLVPWGLWITIDLTAIALSAGAFSLCAAVYLLGLKKYQPLAHTAAYIGLIGYSMAMLCLLLDIGRPDRFYYGFVFWNVHSVLWEVTMCVGLYFSVLVMENLTTLAELDWLQTRYPKLAAWMHKTHDYAPYLAVAGLLLSMLHQSSLGATYGVLIGRPIWYRPGLAVLFFLSAIGGGIALTLLASLLAGLLSSKVMVDKNLIYSAARFLGWFLLGYLYMRFWDMFAMTYTHQPGREEALAILASGQLSFNLWVGEILLGLVAPIFLLLNRRTRHNTVWLLVALALTVGGVAAYRWDTNLVGQMVVQLPLNNEAPLLYASYIPSLIEIAVGLGIVAFGLLAFSLGVQYLKVVDHRHTAH